MKNLVVAVSQKVENLLSDIDCQEGTLTRCDNDLAPPYRTIQAPESVHAYEYRLEVAFVTSDTVHSEPICYDDVIESAKKGWP